MKALGCIAFVTALALPLAAHAQESAVARRDARANNAAPARRYARGSVGLQGSLYLGGSLEPTYFTFAASSGGTVRFVVPSGLAFTVGHRHGANYQGSVGSSAPSAVRGIWGLSANARVGVGWAFALSDHVAFTPMVSYSVGVSHFVLVDPPPTGFPVQSATQLRHSARVELPFAIYLSRNVYYEPGLFVDVNPDPTFGVQLSGGFSQSLGFTF